MDDRKRSETLRGILRASVSTFVNLVTVRENTELHNYRKEITQHVGKSDEGVNHIFLDLAIGDGGVAPDLKLLALSERCVQLMSQGHCLYVHCYGGHGRAGTLCAVLLGLMYNISGDEALVRIQAYHNTRVEDESRFGLGASPAAECQRAQVRRILSYQ